MKKIRSETAAARSVTPRAGGVIPTIPLLDRISALDADLIVEIASHAA